MKRTIVRNVRLIDGSGTPQDGNKDVVIHGSRVVSIQNAGASGGVDVTVDGTGKFLIPGIWETEGHVTRYSNAIPADMNLAWPGEGKVARVHDNLRSYLASGVTTVVDLGGPPDVLSSVRADQAAGNFSGARLLYVGRQFTAVGGQPIVGGHTISAVTTQVDDPTRVADLVRAAVEEYKIDGIKANYTVGGGPFPLAPILRRGVLDALVEAGQTHGLPVLVHIDAASAALDALHAGVDNIEHMFLPDLDRGGEDILEVAEACASAGAYWPFTLALWETFARPNDASFLADLHLEGVIPSYVLGEMTSSPESQWVHPPRAMVDHYRVRFAAGMEHIASVHRLGVRMTIATDAGNPAVFHGPGALREMVLMVEAGISPMQTLVSATRMAAEKFRRGHELGTIEVGKIADMVLLAGDPLLDIRNIYKIDSVIQAGEVMTAASLRQRTAS